MLNCTDLACVLHHHHFYAHLHHLKHHLQDENSGTGIGIKNDFNENDDTKSNIRESDSDLSSLSHLDAPNDFLYVISGVIIAMVLVCVIIILVAVTINKLRKREESISVSPVRFEVQEQQRSSQSFARNGIQTVSASENLQQSAVSEANQIDPIKGNQSVTFVRTSGSRIVGHLEVPETDRAEWTFPPKVPTPHIYHCMNPELLVASSDKNGFKGFRKQFSGRFKRLVARKPEPTPVIPPELKPQLKTIYVY